MAVQTQLFYLNLLNKIFIFIICCFLILISYVFTYLNFIKVNEVNNLINIPKGSSIYKIENLISQKINALLNRTKARDLYDVNFLVNNYLDSFTHESLLYLLEICKNLDNIANEYKILFQDDYLFSEDLLFEIILNLESKYSDILKKSNREFKH